MKMEIKTGPFGHDIIKLDSDSKLCKDDLYELIRYCINMDSWKYSWHNDVKNEELWPKLERIILDKISDRKLEMEILKECIFQMKLNQ